MEPQARKEDRMKNTYGRGFPPAREIVTDTLLWFIAGFILLVLFLAGLWYVWPENGIAPAPTEHTHATLVVP